MEPENSRVRSKRQEQTFTDQMIDVFDPLKIVELNLLQYEITTQLAEYPEISRKLHRVFELAESHFSAGSILSSRMCKAVERMECLQQENERLKKRISDLELSIEFIQ